MMHCSDSPFVRPRRVEGVFEGEREREREARRGRGAVKNRSANFRSVVLTVFGSEGSHVVFVENL